jgi:hypothetical protein
MIQNCSSRYSEFATGLHLSTGEKVPGGQSFPITPIAKFLVSNFQNLSKPTELKEQERLSAGGAPLRVLGAWMPVFGRE